MVGIGTICVGEHLARSGGELRRSDAEVGRSGAEVGRSGSEVGRPGSELRRSGAEIGRSDGRVGGSDSGVARSGAEVGGSGSEVGRAGGHLRRSGREVGGPGAARRRSGNPLTGSGASQTGSGLCPTGTGGGQWTEKTTRKHGSTEGAGNGAAHRGRGTGKVIVDNVTRAGAAALSKSLSNELGGYGITVNTIAPGFIATEMAMAWMAELAREQGQDPAAASAALDATIPLQRQGTSEEIGATVAFLCSQRASYITGQMIMVDGGLVGAPY